MRLTSQRNQCQGCKQYFNSNTAFEKHRTGKHGVDRRCMTPDEMTALGMLVNDAGFWITEKYDGNRFVDAGETEQPEPDDSEATEGDHKSTV